MAKPRTKTKHVILLWILSQTILNCVIATESALTGPKSKCSKPPLAHLKDSNLVYQTSNMSLIQKLEPLAKQRLFAVIHMFGNQKVITNGDLLMVKQDIPLECGQQLLLNKCLILGGKDFSLIGRPLLDKELFRIQATVVEKTMSDTTCNYRHTPRSRGVKKYLFQAGPRTVLRINDIELKKLPD